MAVVYIRLPHYVASFLRNQDEQHPHPHGVPFVLDNGDPLYAKLRDRAIPNNRCDLSGYCFSELQWNAMRHGKYLSFREGLLMDIQRDSSKPLTISEVYLLSGNDARVRRDPQTMELMPDSDYPEEYVPFQLPRVVVRNGREQKVYSNWYLPSINDFRSELTTRFNIALVRFVAKEYNIIYAQMVESSLSGTNSMRSRAKVEAIDRFMLRYEIRPDERSRELMKKMLRRSTLAGRYSLDTDYNHAAWSTEQTLSREVVRSSRPVICTNTGERFNSISEAARHIGVSYADLRVAISRGYRCHGFSFTYAPTSDNP